MNASINAYRILSRVYPVSFRRKYGPSVDQAFRDLLRDAFEARGYAGVLLLWLHVIADFVFSAGELFLRRAGDFLKWRLRLQWVVACTLGYILTGLLNTIGRESLRPLGPVGTAAISTAVLIAGLGFLQSRVLDRCFRRAQWVIYGIAGAVLPTLIVVPFLIRANIVAGQNYVMNWLGSLRAVSEVLYWLLANLVARAPLIILGAAIGLAQAAAIRGGTLTARRWVVACAAGYFASEAIGGTVGFFTAGNIGLQLFAQSLTKGAVLGLITAGTLENIVLKVRTNRTEQS